VLSLEISAGSDDVCSLHTEVAFW